MKCNSLTVIFSLLLTVSAFSAPDISMEVYRFRTDSTTYIEVSLYFVGSTLQCDTVSANRYGVEYIIMIKDSTGHVQAGNRYQLTRNGCPAKDIFDIRRFPIQPGNYVVQVEAFDLTDTLHQVSVTQEIQVESAFGRTGLSDGQLLSMIKSEPEQTSPFHKSGIYLEPLPFRLYYPALSTLYLYIESYHGEQLEGQPYLQYTLKPIKGDYPQPIVTYKKVKKEHIAANIIQLDISKLLTGEYMLEAALYDGNKQPVESRKIIFNRLNPVGDSIFIANGVSEEDLGFALHIPDDSLDYYIRAVAPIANSLDVEAMNTILDKGSPKSKRYFLHKFWTKRSGKLAGVDCSKYMRVAIAVDKTYQSGFGYGFETDRGHIFLKYGQPSDIISVEDEPSAPPYEIWFYTSMPQTRQSNVRFLFYNPSLVRNEFKLLHSTAIGEVQNSRWEVELYKDATLETPGVDESIMGDNVHRNARTYFEY
jgi:GWxTD domain-containing protein